MNSNIFKTVTLLPLDNTLVLFFFTSPCSVHLKIHIPKIIKKHTHVQTIYKHHFHKKPVHDHGGDEDDGNDGLKDGSEKYIRIDPKALSAALKVVQGGGGLGNELRSFRYMPKYHRSRDLKNAYSSPMSYKSAKFYPKNMKVYHQYEDVEPYRRPSKSHRAIKHMMRPAYEIHEDMDDDYDHPKMQEDYSLSESSPVKTYYKPPASMNLKTAQIQFIPASQVNDYIPTIPFSALTAQQSQFQPIWTPADLMSRAAAAKAKEDDVRLGRSTHYEGTTTRIYTSGGPESISRVPSAPSQFAHNFQN